MSGLEDRCTSFHDAARGTGKSKGPEREMATLRRFLHKNQNQRFTDKATARIFDTIQIYATDKQLSTDDREGLLEDALKMPFTVFSTKQKKTMLKWIEEVRGGGGTLGGGGQTSTAAVAAAAARTSNRNATTVLSIMDICAKDDTVHLMTPSGDETFEVTLSSLTPALRRELQNAFDAIEESLEVQAVVHNDGTTVDIVGLNTN